MVTIGFVDEQPAARRRRERPSTGAGVTQHAAETRRVNEMALPRAGALQIEGRASVLPPQSARPRAASGSRRPAPAHAHGRHLDQPAASSGRPVQNQVSRPRPQHAQLAHNHQRGSGGTARVSNLRPRRPVDAARRAGTTGTVSSRVSWGTCLAARIGPQRAGPARRLSRAVVPKLPLRSRTRTVMQLRTAHVPGPRCSATHHRERAARKSRRLIHRNYLAGPRRAASFASFESRIATSSGEQVAFQSDGCEGPNPRLGGRTPTLRQRDRQLERRGPHHMVAGVVAS